MNETTEPAESTLGSLRRREFLTKAAAAGAIAWTAPMILSRPAWAQDGGGGTPNCRPTGTPTCVRHDCRQGGKFFPGISVVTTDTCVCGTPSEPTSCIKIDPDSITSSCGAVIAYGNGVTCGPLGPNEEDDILSTGTWMCFDPDFPIFFGPPRSGGDNQGAIPAIPSDCTISFRAGVWTGDCFDTSGGDAFSCRTWDITIVWNQGTKMIQSCTITPAAEADSLCTGVGSTSPCGEC